MPVEIRGLNETMAELQKGIVQRVTDAMTSITLIATTRVKEQKLSLNDSKPGGGQVLHARTGRLRRSITSRVEDKGSLIVGTIGTNVEYARRWEEGRSADAMMRIGMNESKRNFHRGLKSKAAIKSRSFEQLKDARPFLQPVLDDMKKSGLIDSTIKAAINKEGTT